MLRESSDAANLPVDLRAVRDSTIDPLTPLGPELLAFTDALVLQDPDELEIARVDVQLLLGEAGVEAVSGVVAAFEMMNRLLDAIGAIESDEVSLSLGDSNSSCLLREPGKDDCKYVVMPMRL